MSAAHDLVFWVVASPDDPSLAPLRALDGLANVVVGADADAFAGAPRPAALMLATGTKPVFEAVWNAGGGRARWVHSRFAGVEHVLFPELVASDAVMTNGRGAFSRALAEFTLGALLFFTKGHRRMIDAQRAGRWEPFEPHELHGKTLGIVGYGSIGRATAELARAFGMRVVATRRSPSLSADEPVEIHPMGWTLEVFRRSDHVLVAAPLTPETRGLVGARELGAMRRHGVLVNVGRGPVVDEAALLEALDADRLLGAALDVFDEEPLPSGHPFYRSDRVLLSPHCADRVPGWLEVATEVFVENARRFARGDALVNVVDKHLGY